ncbi:MAG: UDP-N-acetylmuramoyl-tripeptide--D-alanyl-D-alanine ligase [Clostridia bacterium]|nr:UDP-N-acetylmuramoyl-tripeptide--D-alanyl-D-alanine ligase [Clostridia bacterium]
MGDVFVGIRGENIDGSSLFEEALENGAKACIINDIELPNDIINKYPDRTIIKVKNTIKAIQEVAKYKRAGYDIPVIGVTGSVGKTSTKDLIASVLSKKYKTLKTKGNYNNHIGIPLTVLGLKDHTAAVIEMGMNHEGEIRAWAPMTRPTMSVITNIGTAHIGLLGSRENILKAKLEILESMEENAPIIINNDNDLLNDWYLKNKDTKNIITYGIENESYVMAKNIVFFDTGSEFDVQIEGKTYKAKINIGGVHFVINALSAICVGVKNDIPMDKILEGISDFELTKNRMEILDGAKGTKIISDCYNASYDSMKAAIEYLGKIKANKKIAILGVMGELGEYEKLMHEKVGEEIYKNKIDVLIAVRKKRKILCYKSRRIRNE